MRLDESSRGVKIPKDVARAIVFAFQLQKRRQSESNMRTRRIYADINCHKTALHAIGVIDSGYNPKDSYNISFFPSEQYVPYRSIENLEEHLRTVGGKGTLLFVQCKMSPAPFAGPYHSFLAGLDEGGRFVCFEKVGANLYPFRITSLSTIYKEYKEGWWAWGSVESIQNHPITQVMRKLKGSPPRDFKSKQ